MLITCRKQQVMGVLRQGWLQRSRRQEKMALRSPPFSPFPPVAGGNSVCVKGIGYQHDSSQVNLDHLAEEVPRTFLPHKALLFLLWMLVSLLRTVLRSMNGVSFLSEGSHHVSVLGFWGEFMSSCLFYHPGDYLLFIYIFLVLPYFLVLFGFRPTLCISFLSPQITIFLRGPVLENSIRN